MARLLLTLVGMSLSAALCFPGASQAHEWADRMEAVPMSAIAGKGTVVVRGPSKAPRTAIQNPIRESGGQPSGAHPASRILYAAASDRKDAMTPIRQTEPPQDGYLPHPLSKVLTKAFPAPNQTREAGPRQAEGVSPSNTEADESGFVSQRRMETHLAPQDPEQSAAAAPSAAQRNYRYLEIEVSHSAHIFKLLGVRDPERKDVLYECKVGLGGREFPTPVGVYFVTHIYDENPWWIPPPNRAWAAGDSPSKRVYGGTMAPLLKKRMLSSKKKQQDLEDYIESEVRLDDDGYRFHGTNSPRSIGFNQSHGCVRMLPKDAGEVAKLIKEFLWSGQEGESENGKFVILKAPVRLNLVK